MSNTKKIALMSTLVLLLAVTAIVNFVLAGTKTATVSGAATAERATYFTTYRATRNTTRSEEFIQLDSVIAANAIDSEEYLAAVARKEELISVMEDELVLESMIKAMGFSDAAVTITDADNINVFVNSDELTVDQMSRILYALEIENNIRNGNVIIMPVYAES